MSFHLASLPGAFWGLLGGSKALAGIDGHVWVCDGVGKRCGWYRLIFDIIL
jgi:hypothetical protein